MYKAWSIRTEDEYPFKEKLLYQGQEISLKDVVPILNGYSEIYSSVTKLKDQLKKYVKFFDDLKIILDLPNDTKQELDNANDKLSILRRDKAQMEHTLFKYNIR